MFEGQSEGLGVGGLAEALDSVGDITKLGNFKRKILANLYRLAQANGFVIDHQIDILIGILVELKYGPDIQFHDLADLHFLLGNPDNDRDLHI